MNENEQVNNDKESIYIVCPMCLGKGEVRVFSNASNLIQCYKCKGKKKIFSYVIDNKKYEGRGFINGNEERRRREV